MKKIAVLLMSVMLCFGLAACGNSDGGSADVDLAAVWSDIEEASGEMVALEDLNDETLQAFYGLEPGDLKQAVVKIAMMNVHADEYFIAEAADGKIDVVKAAVEKRQADLEEKWQRYLPEQYDKVMNSKTVVSGNYVLYVISGDPSIAVDAFNTALGE